MIEQMLLLTVVVKVTLLMSLMHVVSWLLEHIALLLLQICFGTWLWSLGWWFTMAVEDALPWPTLCGAWA